MPASQFAQKKVGVVAWLADVVHHGRATDLAGVVDDDVAEAEQSLRNTGGYGYVLDLTQGDVSCCAGDQSGVDLKLCVGDCVANHVSPDVVVTRNQQQRECERDRDRRGYTEAGE